MGRGYSDDLRVRVIRAVEAGASARAAAGQFDIGNSTAIRWVKRWRTSGSASAKPGTGHCRSPLEKHCGWLLDLVEREPDITLEEIRVRLCEEHNLAAGIGSVWRFFERHGISFKKNRARRRAGPP